MSAMTGRDSERASGERRTRLAYRLPPAPLVQSGHWTGKHAVPAGTVRYYTIRYEQ